MHICYNHIWVIIMANFCLKCWNEINRTDDPARKYIFSKELDLCEGCGQWAHVIVAQRKYYYRRKFRFVIFPFKVIYILVYTLWRILILPYIIYQYRKSQKDNHD